MYSRHIVLQLGNVTEQRRTPVVEGVTDCGHACHLQDLHVGSIMIPPVNTR